MTPFPHTTLYTEPSDLAAVREWVWDYIGKLTPYYSGEDLATFVREVENLCQTPGLGIYPRYAHDTGLYFSLLLDQPVSYDRKAGLEADSANPFLSRLSLLPRLLEADLAGLMRVERLILPEPEVL